MKRTIKFRGKRVDNGEWIYGDLFTSHEDHHSPSTSIAINEFNPLSYGSKSRHIVNPETVGQFTGLLDKKGQEVYEGDVVNISIQGKEVVEAEIIWEYCSLVFAIEEYANRDFATAMEECKKIGLRLYEIIEVIGNIYEPLNQ
jgi:uncharacterized phage protein (TIGR01671 family)